MTSVPTSPPAYRESAQLLACEGERLMAVLAEPGGAVALELGIVIVVGGPQYRAGSHRQFVHLARALAAAGTPTLRFDVRGMGDSTGAQRSFEQITRDIGAAVDMLLAAQNQLRGVVLWGLCDGASAALLYLHDHADVRVTGLCLVNPWVRSQTSLARTHVKHYYTQRLRDRSFWLKLLSGRVAGAALRGLIDNLRQARTGAAATAGPQQPFQARMRAAWRAFDGPILLTLSGNDYTAREFIEYVQADPAWGDALRQTKVSRCDLVDADHTLSARHHQCQAEAHLLQWLRTMP